MIVILLGNIFFVKVHFEIYRHH